MLCEQCQKEGLRSTVEIPMFGTTTLLAFTPGHYDEDGNYVPHENPNTTTMQYECSNGHKFTKTS